MSSDSSYQVAKTYTQGSFTFDLLTSFPVMCNGESPSLSSLPSLNDQIGTQPAARSQTDSNT